MDRSTKKHLAMGGSAARGAEMQPAELIKQLDAAFDLRRTEDFANALKRFERLERKSWHPQDINAIRVYQAMCLTDLGRYEEAHKLIQRVDWQHLGEVDRIDFESECARIEWKRGHIEDALAHISKTFRLIDSLEDKSRVRAASDDFRSMQGVILAELGRCKEAIPILENVPIESSWWVTAKTRIGECKIRKRLHQEAIACYQEILSSSIDLDPVSRTTAIRNIGCAYFYMGKYREAIDYPLKVERGYEEYPGIKAELFSMLAAAYARLGMTHESSKYTGWAKGTDTVQ